MQLNIFDWLEAFQAHPRIGDRKPSADDQFSRMSQSEQAMASETSNQSIATQLAEWNAMYEKRFGHIFLIYASGRTANEILSELQKRYVFYCGKVYTRIVLSIHCFMWWC